MDDFDRIRDLKQRVQAGLRAIPGVHAVGVGPKITGGKHTGQPAIVVFVEKKKPLSELAPGEIIPAEIEGIKTDVHEAPVPYLVSEDTSSYSPLLGGIQIQPGGALGGLGTLGCIARIDEPTPRIVALTCEHVVGMASGAGSTDLTAAVAVASVSFAGPNTHGAIVIVDLNVTPGAGQPVEVRIIQRAPVGTAAATVAKGISDKANALPSPGFTAAVAGAQVNFTPVGTNAISVTRCSVDGLHNLDSDSGLKPSVAENVITLAGQAKSNGAAYVAINLGGSVPSYGVYAGIEKGDAYSTVAASIARAINLRALPGVTATAASADVTVTGVEELECDISSDIRVGQPINRFCSKCCKCCDDRIGKVIDARLDLDVALVQLDPGLKYMADMKDIGVVKGSHAVKDAETTAGPYKVKKRGRTTRVTNGTIAAMGVDGVARALHRAGDIAQTPEGTPPAWTLFHRHYTEAILVTANAGDFAQGGDSGSAVLNDANDSNEVIGILFGGGKGTGIGLVSPIQPILDAFNLIVEIADNPGKVQIVPAAATHFSAIEAEPVVTVTEAVEPPFAAAIMKHLQQAESEITAIPAGRMYAEAARRHADEAARLVNANRRVATVWQRNGGPQILQAALSVTSSPDRKLPAEIQGKPLAECLRKIQKVFMRYGSAAFAADLMNFGPRLIELSGLTYGQTLAALQAAGQE